MRKKLKELPKPLKPFVKKINVKTKKITIRVTPEQYLMIKNKALSYKLTITELIIRGVENL